MSGMLCALSLTGSGGGLTDTQTTTTGTSGVSPDRFRGFSSALAIGTCSDGTSNLYGGANILEILHDESANAMRFSVSGNQSNSGWTTMTIKNAGTPVLTLLRADAVFTGGTNSTWEWTTGVTYPFGINGNTRTVEFT